MLQAASEALPYLAEGTLYTVAISIIALLIGLLIGLVIAMMRVYGGRVARQAATLYVLILRGFPSLVTLFIVYFVLASSVNLSPFLAGCFALGVTSSAYQA